jgi:hypothetical protein
MINKLLNILLNHTKVNTVKYIAQENGYDSQFIETLKKLQIVKNYKVIHSSKKLGEHVCNVWYVKVNVVDEVPMVVQHTLRPYLLRVCQIEVILHL